MRAKGHKTIDEWLTRNEYGLDEETISAIREEYVRGMVEVARIA